MSTPLWSRGEPVTDWDTLELGGGESTALLRLWRGFMVARCFVALVLLLLLADAGWHWLQQPVDSSARFVQAALTGTGLFVVALLAHELARRLTREEAVAQRNRSSAQMQAQVNDLVIETLSEGVLVIDA